MIKELKEILNTFIEEATMEAEEISDPNSYAKGFTDAIIETSQNILTVLETI
jgi:hypothetical protein